MKLGLTSITFRGLSIEEIVAQTAKNGLDSIEWGGDIHCPPGDVEKAAHAKKLCEEQGLTVSSYGSYYRLGAKTQENITEEFGKVLSSAIAMSAPIIRVWAGGIPSEDVTPNERKAMVAEAIQISTMAEKSGIVVAFEYHARTLTDRIESTLELMGEIAHKNCKLYWQPNFELSLEKNVADLDFVLPYLACVHTFSWEKGFARLPLSERLDWWKEFLYLTSRLTPSVPMLIEFVKDDSLEQFSEDCKTLLTFR